MQPETISNMELSASLLGMILEVKAELIALRELLAEQGVQIDRDELIALRRKKLLPAMDELAEGAGRADSAVGKMLRDVRASLEELA
ncbi:MAG: hypothetical protein QM346_19495 [Chloroflexota bacterium]|mgnify:CR=1 FL=1|nr:hypothetical protein [Chloroflexota bacterium]